ncbi:MAG: hypothetical protein ACTHNW_06015 [Mucilaginibacter sp.]
MNAAQKLTSNYANISTHRNALGLQPVDNNKLEMLLADTVRERLDIFEQVHTILYPLIFTYASLFPVDRRKIDQMLVDVFFCCWKNQQFTSCRELKIGILKNLRNKITVALSIEGKQNELLIPQLLENEYLKRFMRLTDDDIAEVNCKYSA